MFKSLLTTLFLAAAATTPSAQETAEVIVEDVLTRWEADRTTVFDASEVDLPALQYIARPVIVFANSPNDPMFAEQMAFLVEEAAALAARDVIIIVDTDPAAETPIREALRPRRFMLVLMDKDGRIAQRKPQPFEGREIWRAIDKMPLRQQELR